MPPVLVSSAVVRGDPLGAPIDTFWSASVWRAMVWTDRDFSGAPREATAAWYLAWQHRKCGSHVKMLGWG